MEEPVVHQPRDDLRGAMALVLHGRSRNGYAPQARGSKPGYAVYPNLVVVGAAVTFMIMIVVVVIVDKCRRQ